MKKNLIKFTDICNFYLIMQGKNKHKKTEKEIWQKC